MVVGLAIPFEFNFIELESIVFFFIGAGEKELTLGDLLALVDLGDLLIEELVTLLADLDDLLALKAQS